MLTFFLSSPQLLRSSEGPVLRRRRHLDPAKPYITAKLPSLPTTFTLGDEKMYNGFYNKPLSSQQEYLCFVLAVLQHEETNTTANYVRGFPVSAGGYRLGFRTQKILLV